MTYTNKLLLSLALAFATALTTFAQTNGSNSPYSRYGYGLLSDRANGFNKGMAGVAYGLHSGDELNSKNPASYSSLDSLTFLFDAGFSLQNGNFAAGNQRVNARNTSFDYIQMGFRATRGLGMVFGMRPFSTVGYKTSQTFPEKEIDGYGYDRETMTYKGDGGVHEVFYGVGWTPHKNIAIGANLGYLWGDLTHIAHEEHTLSAINTRRTEYSTHIQTYKAEFGVQYAIPTKKSGIWTIGAVYGLGHNVNNNAHRYRQTLSSGTVQLGDSVKVCKGFSLPHSIGVGLGWNYYNRWRVGFDYTFEKWGNVKYPYTIDNQFVSTKGKMLDKHSIAFGGEFMPNPNGLKWADRVVYRAGVSFSTPYSKVEHNNKWVDGPRNICVSIGAGLPIVTKRDYPGHHSIVNISAQYERVQPKMSGMVTENYIRLCIGITFNELWFMKWKVD